MLRRMGNFITLLSLYKKYWRYVYAAPGDVPLAQWCFGRLRSCSTCRAECGSKDSWLMGTPAFPLRLNLEVLGGVHLWRGESRHSPSGPVCSCSSWASQACASLFLSAVETHLWKRHCMTRCKLRLSFLYALTSSAVSASIPLPHATLFRCRSLPSAFSVTSDLLKGFVQTFIEMELYWIWVLIPSIFFCF